MFNAQEITISPHRLEHRKLAQHRADGGRFQRPHKGRVVLRWSLLEAMSCGCAVVGSATAPVQEVIEHGRNGLLVDFFSPSALAAAIAELLHDRPLAQRLGEAARTTVLQHFNLASCVQRQLALMDLVASGAIGG